MPTFSDDYLRDKIFGCFFGCAIVDDSAGEYTRLFLRTAANIARAKGFDEVTEATMLAALRHERKAAWEPDLERAANRYSAWLASGNTSLHPKLLPTPLPEAKSEGLGMSPACRIAPLALWLAFNGGTDDEFKEGARRFGKLTHGDPRSWYAALVVALMVKNGILYDRRLDWEDEPPEFWRQNMSIASQVAGIEAHDYRMYGSSPRYADDPTLRAPVNPFVSDGLRFSFRLKQAARWSQAAGVDDADLLARLTLDADEVLRTSPLAAVPLAFAFTCRYCNDFEAAVGATKKIGADMHAAAATVGAMSGSRLGYRCIPPHLIAALAQTQKEEVAASAESFCEAVKRQREESAR